MNEAIGTVMSPLTEEILAKAKVHTLASGATLISLSPHEFRFSDGTVSEPQTQELCDTLTLGRRFEKIGSIKGMQLNRVSMGLDAGQQQLLARLCRMADIVLVPFPVLTALREQRIRESYFNVVAFNATEATQRAAPDQKIVDVNNWSW